MTLFKKLSLVSAFIALLMFTFISPILMWFILKQYEINHTFLKISGSLFLACIMFGTFTQAIDEIWQKRALSLGNLISTIIWIALIFFWLGMKFTMTLKG